MDPLIGFILPHPKEPPVENLQGIALEVAQDKEQAILGDRQRTVLIGAVGPCGAAFAVQAPVGHTSLKRLREGFHQDAKLLHRQAGKVQHLVRSLVQVCVP